MNKRFTKLIAALALLVFMTPSLAGWGQTTVTSSLIFTAKCNGSGTADDGVNWTVTSDGTESNFDNTKGIHYGTNSAAVQYIRLNTSEITGTITKVVVNASTASGVTATVGVTVGGNVFGGDPQALNTTATDYTFEGSASGEIVVTNTKPSSATKALYVKSVVVTYNNGGGTPTCATPTFSPAAGTYTEAQSVEISCATEGATIYYTTNGDVPTTSSTVYAAPISVSSNMTIKAMAAAQGYDNSAVATASYTVVNIEHAGTEADPYTVADARAAIDANAGTQGVYATGIVSEIVTAYNSQYGNITFNMVDEEGDEIFLQAYRCTGDEAANVVVGDIAVVYGNLTKYGETYEFGQGCQVVSLTHPSTPYITAEDVNIACDATNGSIAYTLNNPMSGGSMSAVTTSEWLTLGNDFNSPIAFTCSANSEATARTATVTLTYTYNRETVTTDVTVTQAAYQAPNVTWDLSIASYDEITDADVVTWSSEYATMTNSSKSGGTSASNYLGGDSNNRTSSRFYSGNTLTLSPATGYAISMVVFTATSTSYATALATSTWTNATASANGTTVTVTPTDGNVDMVATIGGTCGFTAVTVYYEESTIVYYGIELDDQIENGIIAANKTRAHEGETITLTATPAENYYLSTWTVLDGAAEEVTVTVSTENPNEATFTMPAREVIVSATFATDLVSYTITIDGDITYGSVVADKTTAFENDEVTLTVTPETGYYLEDGNLIVMAGSDEVTVTKEDATNFTFIMPASDVVVLAEFTEFTGGVLYTLATTIESGKHYIIASGKDDGTVYVMGGQNSNNRAAVAQSVEDGMIMTSSLDVSEFVINGPDANGYYIIYDAEVPGYLFAPVSGNNNYLRTQQFNDNKGQWTISIDADNSEANVVANAEGRNTMRYNSSNNVFSCYASGQQPIYLYEKDGETEYTFYKDITGFGEAENGNYYLIASPVAVAPANVNQMIAQTAGNYDLYAFDQSEAKEWLNYKQHNFSLDPGTGYLYANSENVTLSFSGEKNNTTSVTLTKTEDEVDFQGWNLIGNPFGQVAYITNDFYRMNESGDEVIEGSGAINPMEGVFVIAESDGQTVTFSTENNAKAVEQVVMNVTRNRGTAIDRAIVRFDEGQQLPKFQLNPNNTKLYIAQGNKDYAIVRSAAQGEMPVSFRAAENGTYTLSIEAENVEMNYLHLIDNMTGMDVDLLATPSYSFEAKTTDYASRFRLVFSANSIDEQNAETFAYFNGSEWVVSNTGEATLQVVDVMGRVLSTETISGNAELSLNQPAGVYMLRLINGNDVKVQKVIVK